MPHKTINGIQFYYETKGEGTPLLFIHGLGSSTLDWENQVPFFAENYKTITIDLRGHGQTDASKETYSIQQFSDDVAAFIQEEITAPVHIVGISMGGMIAFQLAVDKPGMVKSLVIINSFTEVVMNKKNRKAIRIRKLIPRIFGMKIMGKILGKKLFPHENQSALRNLIATRWAKNTVKDYIKSTNAIVNWNITSRLSEIKCPVLVVAAEQDYTSVEDKQAYTDKLPNGKLVVIPDAGHAVSMEKPKELNEVVFGFLGK